MPEIRYTIRISDMPRRDEAMAAILRAQGMFVTDECRGVQPSVLTWEDNINGAGARTFIWRSPDTSSSLTSAAHVLIGNGGGASWHGTGYNLRTSSPSREPELRVQETNVKREVRLKD